MIHFILRSWCFCVWLFKVNATHVHKSLLFQTPSMFCLLLKGCWKNVIMWWRVHYSLWYLWSCHKCPVHNQQNGWDAFSTITMYHAMTIKGFYSIFSTSLESHLCRKIIWLWKALNAVLSTLKKLKKAYWNTLALIIQLALNLWKCKKSGAFRILSLNN